MNGKKVNGGSQEQPPLRASEVGPVTPTNKAIYEAGKSMLIESVSTGREFCKFMIGTSMGAIPIYLALLKFILPEKYVPTVGVGILSLIPAVLFLVAGIIFLIGYFPQQGIASLDIPAEIERERRTTVKRRQRIGVTGFTVFCVAIVAGLLITGSMLRMPRGDGNSDAPKSGTESGSRGFFSPGPQSSSPGGISPPGPHRSRREPLDSSGSSCPPTTVGFALLAGSSHFWLTHL